MKSIFHNKARAFCFASTLIMSASAMQANAQSLEISAAKELLWDQTQSLYEAIEMQTPREARNLYQRRHFGRNTITALMNKKLIVSSPLMMCAFLTRDYLGKGTHLDYDVRQNFML